MKLVSKVMEECSKATGTMQVNSLAMSQRLSQYVEFKGFDESICQDFKEVDDVALYQANSKVVSMSLQNLIDFQKLKTAFDERQISIEGNIRLAKEKFEEVNKVTKINDLKGFIGNEVTNEDLSNDILTQLNQAFTAALSTAAEQRSRTTKFFADELKTLKSDLVVQRQ